MPDRPSKKQHELLEFIAKFIDEHGYGPSYREIMNGCNYSSVATVAVHIDNLVKKGRLAKNGRSARSLEIVNSPEGGARDIQEPSAENKKKWLADLIGDKFAVAEKSPSPEKLNELETLVSALKTLGLNDMAGDFQVRLEEIK